MVKVWILIYFFTSALSGGMAKDPSAAGRPIASFGTLKDCMDEVTKLENSSNGYGVCVEGEN